MISLHGKRLAACACVIEGSGFRAAITSGLSTQVELARERLYAARATRR